MAIAFNNLKNKIGLDDKLTFGKYHLTGMTVQDIINDDPDYIKWLIREDKQFYQSVHDELKWHAEKSNDSPDLNRYNPYGYLIPDWDDVVFDDIPF